MYRFTDVYLCITIYLYIYISVYLYSHICESDVGGIAGKYTSIYMYIYFRQVYIDIDIYIYICLFTYLCICVRICVCVHQSI